MPDPVTEPLPFDNGSGTPDRLPEIHRRLELARAMTPDRIPTPLTDDLAWLLDEVERLEAERGTWMLEQLGIAADDA